MRIVVDREVCMSHGQCEFTAPGVFALDDDGVVTHPPTVPEGQDAAVADAVALCPTQAIRLDAWSRPVTPGGRP